MKRDETRISNEVGPDERIGWQVAQFVDRQIVWAMEVLPDEVVGAGELRRAGSVVAAEPLDCVTGLEPVDEVEIVTDTSGRGGR